MQISVDNLSIFVANRTNEKLLARNCRHIDSTITSLSEALLTVCLSLNLQVLSIFFC
jgi:hypothetical protein